MANLSLSRTEGPVAAAVAWAERRPEAVLYWVLGLHLVIWTVLPILVCPNLQLDLAEDLALGKEWQLGYWKHPPLPWWLADLAYRLVPHSNVVYLLGPLVRGRSRMYVTWRLAREVVAPIAALVAVLALEGIHYFTFSVPKFAHDHTLLVFWALTGWFFWRAVARERLRDWMLAGACLALCFWSKYTAFAYAATLGLFLLFDPVARRTLANARALPDGARVPGRARAAPVVARRLGLPAVPLRRGARGRGDPLVPHRHVPAALDRKPGPRARCRRSA